MIENNIHNLEEALNYLEKKKIENNNNIHEKNEISGYESDTSSVVSSNSNTSRKRERQESKLPTEKKERKISKQNYDHNFAKPQKLISNYYGKNNINQTSTKN